jgi:peptide/nickel transport system ATP-binding protein
MSDILLEIRDLKTHFFTREGVVRAVDGLDLVLYRNRTLCVVGESGCGKSITASSILQLLRRPGRIVGGEIVLHRRDGSTVDIVKLAPSSRRMRDVRGREISMIFQEPMTSLSPVHPIGDQIAEMIRLHTSLTKAQCREKTIRLLGRVGIPKPEDRYGTYPFQLSGGMRQRVMIAMALSCEPALLIADEPTTALDVTTQANILELIREVQDEFGIAVMLITHDLGVVAEVADEVAVMYLGKAVETADVRSLFRSPKHPYTQALLQSIPKLDAPRGQRLPQIEGMVPNPLDRPEGCPFNTRCPQVREGICDAEMPRLLPVGPGRQARCFAYDERYAQAFAPRAARTG